MNVYHHLSFSGSSMRGLSWYVLDLESPAAAVSGPVHPVKACFMFHMGASGIRKLAMVQVMMRIVSIL